MVQVLLNLLSNGVKFSDAGETVQIRWSLADAPGPAAELDRDAGPWLRIQVSDAGPGIPRDRLGDLFQPFSQIRKGDARNGSGLGLTISREFVRLMGGDITVESEPGVGSTFTVWLTAAS